MVTIGIKGREEAVVLPELTAKHIGSGTVGQGTHERFIIDEKKFGAKMNAKKK